MVLCCGHTNIRYDVVGYFLPDNTPVKTLFEYHQELLEKNNEKLSEFTENHGSSDSAHQDEDRAQVCVVIYMYVCGDVYSNVV